MKNRKTLLQKLLLLSAVYILFVFQQLNAQTISWTTYHAASSQNVTGTCIANNANGYTVAGTTTTSSGYTDIRIVRLTFPGVILWSATYDFATRNDAAVKVLVDVWGNSFIFCTSYKGATSSQTDAVLVKYNTLGVFQWAKVIDYGLNDAAADMVLDGSGNIVVTANITTASWVTDNNVRKYSNSTGALMLNFIYSTAVDERVSKMKLDASENIYFCGYDIISTRGTQGLIVKYSSTGAHQWTRKYNLAVGVAEDYFHDLAIDASGFVFVSGNSYFNTTNRNEATICRYASATGILTSSNRYHNDRDDLGLFVRLNSAGNPYMAVYSYGITPDVVKISLVKYSNDLLTVLNTDLNNISVNGASLSGFEVSSAGKAMITGCTNTLTTPQYFAIKYKANGIKDFIDMIPSTSGTTTRSSSANAVLLNTGTPFPDDDFVVTGYDNQATLYKQIIIRKYTGPAPRFVGDEITSSIPMLNIFPNPATNFISLSGFENKMQIVLMDMTGRIVFDKKINPEEKIPVAGLPRGNYLLQCVDENKNTSQNKIILQ